MKGLNRTKIKKRNNTFFRILTASRPSALLPSFQLSQGSTSEVSRHDRRHRCPEEAHLKLNYYYYFL